MYREALFPGIIECPLFSQGLSQYLAQRHSINNIWMNEYMKIVKNAKETLTKKNLQANKGDKQRYSYKAMR